MRRYDSRAHEPLNIWALRESILRDPCPIKNMTEVGFKTKEAKAILEWAEGKQCYLSKADLRDLENAYFELRLEQLIARNPPFTRVPGSPMNCIDRRDDAFIAAKGILKLIVHQPR